MIPVLASLAVALQRPPHWLSPYVRLIRRILDVPECGSVAAALNAVSGDGAGWRFVDHAALPAGESYEAFIARTRCVPTRDNLHDMFNGLMWLSYPLTKRRLNALQAQEIALHGMTARRGPLRDGLTLFDENAAVLRAPAALVEALRRREWSALFGERRAQWQSAQLVVFGHALMEKLMQPRKAITAHVWTVAEITDQALASSLSPERLFAREFLPLPVLGVPGWWPANENPDFYNDAEVFRPARKTTTP